MELIIVFYLISIMVALWMIFFKIDSITEVTIIKEKEKDEGFRNRVRRVSTKPVSKHVMGRSNAHHHNRLSNEQAGTKNHSKEEK